jgi:hypothetical protein
MANILLVEPDYRSKFPPLGLLRLSSYHKVLGDSVTFVRGKDEKLRSLKWHTIYVSSLFTYELPRTVSTIRYYSKSVADAEDIIVGGIGATLMPDYIRQNVTCRIMTGPLSKPKLIGAEKVPIAKYDPDYTIMDNPKWNYLPRDSYFCRVSTGCIRQCKFCAVPKLEPEFAYFQPISKQIKAVNEIYGERQNLVLLDNNILACENISGIINSISKNGFSAGSIRNGKQRTVDFNQGIDARLITPLIAKDLSQIALSPIRLAFDYVGMEKQYTHAINLLSQNSFNEYTNYVMYNFNDDPDDFYYRIRLNAELSEKIGIRITSFPMRFRPIYSTVRGYVSEKWKWRYLRGIQCILLATHGLVSPNLVFFNAAFGENVEQFYEIISMPDRYIIFREKYQNNGVNDWRRSYRHLSPTSKIEFMDALEEVKLSQKKAETISRFKKFSKLFEHYYPDGKAVSCE